MSVHFPNLSLPSVMVVDDYPDAAEWLAVLLRTRGYETTVALSGQEALNTESAPEIVILELRLRDTDGYELVRTMRERAGTAPDFIAVTTCGRPEDFARSARAGIKAHLIKPTEADELITALAHVSSAHFSQC